MTETKGLPMKFCKDCAHFINPTGLIVMMPDAPFCSHDKTRDPVDLVYGYKKMNSCSTLRQDDGMCGYEAVLFEPKATKTSRRWFEKK